MHLVDIVILGLIAVAFAAVCVRVRRKGSCMDCGSAGGCTGHCSAEQKKSCPACQGLDAVTEKLGRGVK